MLFLHKVLLQLLLVIAIAHADKCPDGSAGLTKALYEGKDPSKYKDVTCVPKYEFQNYAGTVVLTGLRLLRSFEEGAFVFMTGKLTVDGEYPALVKVGYEAFSSIGNAQSSITFISLPLLKQVSSRTFYSFKGIITFTGSFPSLSNIGGSAFEDASKTASTIAIECSTVSSGSSLTIVFNAFYGYKGTHDASGEQIPCYGNPGTPCTLLALPGFECADTTTGECITHCCAAAAAPPTCDTECGNSGACVLPLTLVSSSSSSSSTPSDNDAWTAADAAASAIRELPSSIVQGSPFFVNDLQTPGLFSAVRGGGGDGKAVDTSKLKLIVRWTKDANTTDAAAAQKYDKYIGKSPPVPSDSDTNLVPYGSDADPGGPFYLDGQTGLVIAAPKKVGNYTAWILIEDPAGVQKAITSDLAYPEVWNQVVVARWNFKVEEGVPFKVVKYTRQPSQERELATEDYTDPMTTTTYAVGDTYRFQSVVVEQSSGTSDALADLQFTIDGAPQGFLIDTNDGYIQGTPTKPGTYNVTLFAVDSRNQKAKVESLQIVVKQKDTDEPDNGPNKKQCEHGAAVDDGDRFDKTFTCDCSGTIYTGDNCEKTSAKGSELVLSVTTTRSEEGDEYTDYGNKKLKLVYYTGINYLIAPLLLNESETIVTEGGVNQIKYTLDGAPKSWFINADTGEMTGRFNEPRKYTFSIDAVDSGGDQQTLEEFEFTVVEPKAFEVIKYARRPSQERDFAPGDYTDPMNTTTYAVGDTYRFNSVVVEQSSGTSDDPADLQFTIDGAPQGFLIDATDGYVQGTPTKPGIYNMTLFAVDSKNQKAKLESLQLVVKRKDTDIPENGPNLKQCEHGAAVDAGDRFDNAFTCNCAGTSYNGENCEIKVVASGSNANTGKVSGGLIGGFAALLVFFGAVYKYRVHQLSMRVFDFEQQLTTMMASGELDPVRDGSDGGSLGPRIPREIKRSHVTPTQVVGSGAFGDVWKAVLDESRSGGVPGYIVAVKTSKDATGEGADEIRKEALVMAQFVGHPNVVALIGVVTSGTPLMLLIALCENGSLQSCLQENKFSSPTLPAAAAAAATAGYIAPSNFDTLKMAIEIARGMDHLVKAKFVHRDLAARNVLLDSQFICKIADFGLSRGIGATDADDDDVKEYYTSRGGTFPVRWTAPEAIETMKFSTATDIWSYGVVLLEITTGGTRPYNAKKNQEVIASVQGGYRAPRPEAGCCPALYNEVMLKCWDADPKVRPSFHELIAILQAQLESVQGEHDFPDSRAAAVDPSAANATAGASEEYLVPGEQVVQSTSALATATSVLGEPEYELETKYELAAPTAQSAGELHRDPAVAVAAPSAAALPRPAAPAPAAFARFRLSLEEQADDSMSLLLI